MRCKLHILNQKLDNSCCVVYTLNMEALQSFNNIACGFQNILISRKLIIFLSCASLLLALFRNLFTWCTCCRLRLFLTGWAVNFSLICLQLEMRTVKIHLKDDISIGRIKNNFKPKYIYSQTNINHKYLLKIWILIRRIDKVFSWWWHLSHLV